MGAQVEQQTLRALFCLHHENHFNQKLEFHCSGRTSERDQKMPERIAREAETPLPKAAAETWECKKTDRQTEKDFSTEIHIPCAQI